MRLIRILRICVHLILIYPTNMMLLMVWECPGLRDRILVSLVAIWFTYFNFILFHVLMHVIIRQPGNTIIAFKGWLSSAFLSR